MDFRQFRYFLTVADLESYRRAAEHLRIAQSALSRHVLELEHRIGTPLFERLPKGVCLTAAGRAFYDEAQLALERADRAFERARRAGAGEIGRLVIGVNDIAARSRVVSTGVAAFRKAFPDIALEFADLTSPEQLDALDTGTIDAGFVIERSDRSEFDHLTVAVDPFELALPRRHRLARCESVEISALREEPFVAVRMRSYWAPQTRLLARCRELGLSPRFELEASTDHMQLNLIGAGLGLGFVNASAAPMLPNDVVLRPVDSLDVRLVLDFVWPRFSKLPALSNLLGVFRDLQC